MYARDYKDLIGGGVLMAIGAFVVIHTLQTLHIGALGNMGPGFLPGALGCILGLLGLAIFLPALFRAGEAIDLDIRSFLAIIASIFAFGFTVGPFGLLPAIFMLTLVAGQADGKLSPIGLATLALCLSAGAILIFRIGLRLPVPIATWPW